MADKICCVPGCGKSRSDNVTLHNFPHYEKDVERFRMWLFRIGGDILKLDNNKICTYRKVCDNHFEIKYKTWSKRLSANAVPTLHMPDIFKNRNPMRDLTNQTCVNPETVTPTTSRLGANVQTSKSDIEQPTTSTLSASVQTLKSDIEQPTTSTLSASVQTLKSDIEQPTTSTLSASVQTLKSDIEQPTTSTVRTRVQTIKPDIQQPTTSTGRVKQSAKIISVEANNLKKEITRLQCAKDKYSERLKKALDLSENQTFQRALKKFSAFALIFTLLQFREINKKIMGRRFTKKEKIMSLALYKQGPKAYRWLRHIFVLPSPLTLSRLISRAALKAGINANIFDNLKKRVRKMKSTDKLCILTFDEISIAPHLDYNRKRDEIVGFVNNGTKKVQKIADHALVFMIRGICKNYKQPIAYTFCTGSTEKIELVRQIKEIIRQLKMTGLNVLATVCDQGASNKSAITYLINETRAKYLRNNLEWNKNTFEIDGNEIVPLFDAPHLIKGMRNNLLNKNLNYVKNGEQKTAKWDHIIKLYEENPAFLGLRMLPKLTEQHVVPNKIRKMKVKYATQVFSKSVAIAMGYLAGVGVLPEESKETAELLVFFDDLFDSVNGSYENYQKKSGKALLHSLTPNSMHFKVWNNSKEMLKSMQYITNNGKSCIVPIQFINYQLDCHIR